MQSSTRKGTTWIYHLFAAFSITAWGLSFISTRILLDHGLHPIEVYIYRAILSYIVLLILCHKQIFANTLKDELLFIACGLVAGSVYYVSENVALQYTLVSNVSLITSLPPLLTVLLMGLFYKSERPSSGVLTGSVVAFIGVGLVIFNSSFNMSLNPVGDLLSLLSAFCWAIYTLMLKPLNAHYTAMFITRKVFFYGFITAIPFLAVVPELSNPLILVTDLSCLLNILFLTLICSIAAFLTWAVATVKIGAVATSNYLYFQPVVTMVFAFFALHEKITPIGFAGCCLILLGVWLAGWLERRQLKNS